MKKEITLLLLLALFLSLTMVFSQNNEIEKLTDEQLKTMSVKEMLEIPETIKHQKNFDRLLENQNDKAERFTKEYFKQKGMTLEKVELDKDVMWEGDVLKSKDEKRWINANNFPEVTEITHKEGAFIIKYKKHDLEYKFTSGSIDKDNNLINENGEYITGEEAEKIKIMFKEGATEGSIDFNGEKFILKEGGSIKIKENSYVYPKSADKEGVLKILQEEGKTFFTAKDLQLWVNNNIIDIPGLVRSKIGIASLTRIYFGKDNFDLKEQGIQIDPGKLLKIEGNDIQVILGQSFNEVSVKGSGVSIENGNLKIKFNNKETLFSRLPKKGKIYSIDRLGNKEIGE